MLSHLHKNLKRNPPKKDDWWQYGIKDVQNRLADDYYCAAIVLLSNACNSKINWLLHGFELRNEDKKLIKQ